MDDIITYLAISFVCAIIGFIVGSYLGKKETDQAVINIRSYFLNEVGILNKRIRTLEDNYYGKRKR